MSKLILTPEKLWCAECGKNFIYYERGIPQKICSFCAGVDSEIGDE